MRCSTFRGWFKKHFCKVVDLRLTKGARNDMGHSGRIKWPINRSETLSAKKWFFFTGKTVATEEIVSDRPI